MSWSEQAIWWHVYPLGFTGAPIRQEDHGDRPWEATRLPALSDWLDYAVELGCNGLLLGPIFASTSHGYDTTDYFNIDPRLGTNADFEEFLAQCKAKGIRVLLDGVFSHVSSENPLLELALTNGPDSKEAALFDVDYSDPDHPKLQVWEGHGNLARFDHSAPQTREFVASVMKYWLEKGVDGWRLDAAYSVPNDFWAPVLQEVREEFPDAWVLGEVIHGDYADFVKNSGADSVTQYELWKATWSSLADENLFELDWTIRRGNELLETFIPNTFVGNHDVTRIATKVGPEKSLVALALLMTLPGIPSIYYGDEQGFTGEKIEDFGGDDAVRPKFPDSPNQLLPFGQAHLRAHQQLIGLRRRHPYVTNGKVEVLDVANKSMTYRTHGDDGQYLEVYVQLEPAPWVSIRDQSGEVLWEGP